MPSLEHGFSRELLTSWAEQPASTVIFTQAAAPGTLAAQLMEHAGIGPGRQQQPAAGLPGAAAGPGRPAGPAVPGLGGGGAEPLVLELKVRGQAEQGVCWLLHVVC